MVSRRIVLLAGLLCWLGGWALYIAAASYTPTTGTPSPRCTQLLKYEWLAPAWICIVSGSIFFMMPRRTDFLSEDDRDRYDRGLDRLVFLMALIYFIAAAPAFALILNSCILEYTIYVPVNTQPDRAVPNPILGGPSPSAAPANFNPERGLFKPSPSPKPVKQKVIVEPQFVRGGMLIGQLLLSLLGVMVFYEWATYVPPEPKNTGPFI